MAAARRTGLVGGVMAALLALGLAALFAAPAGAWWYGWSDPERLSPVAEDAFTPTMTVTPDGLVHLVYKVGPASRLEHRTWDGAAWSSPEISLDWPGLHSALI